MRAQTSCRGRVPKFKWMSCVQFSLIDVDIYAHGMAWPSTLNTCADHEAASCIGDADFGQLPCERDSILTENSQLAFKTRMQWNIDSISTSFVEWMNDGDVSLNSMSRVGLLTSYKFQAIVSDLLGEDLSRSFRLLLETSSIFYSHDGETQFLGYSHTQLRCIQNAAGTRVLRMLQSALSKSVLAQCHLGKLKALFLILIGTIIAVGYSDSQSFSKSVR